MHPVKVRLRVMAFVIVSRVKNCATNKVLEGEHGPTGVAAAQWRDRKVSAPCVEPCSLNDQ